MAASWTAILRIQWKRTITGPLPATPDPPIRTGSSSPPVANNAGPDQLHCAAIGAVVAALAVGLARDTGSRRLALSPVCFDLLEGWGNDNVAAALSAFVKSCAQFLIEPDSAPFGVLEEPRD